MEDKQEQVDKAAKNQSVEYELQEIIDEDSVGRLGGAKTQYSVRNMGHQWGIPGSWLCTLTESPWACWSTQSERRSIVATRNARVARPRDRARRRAVAHPLGSRDLGDDLNNVSWARDTQRVRKLTDV